jgi:outer membrane lipase/esterase
MLCRITLFLALSISLFGQIPFTQFVVFGDSLSDNGNLLVGTTLLGEPQPIPPQYATGEYTDGTNSVPPTTGPLGLWIEQLATKMNLPVPQPYAKGGGGTNYAVASALTGKNPAFSPTTPSVPWITDQLNLFLGLNHTIPLNALYTFWGGANDILGGVDPATAVSNIQGNINTLAAAGAKYFFWSNQPPLGEVPENINTSNRTTFDAASVTYNTA